MYSPKIEEALIPHLYLWAKSDGVKMTKLVNQIISKEVKKHNRKKGGDESAGQSETNA